MSYRNSFAISIDMSHKSIMRRAKFSRSASASAASAGIRFQMFENRASALSQVFCSTTLTWAYCCGKLSVRACVGYDVIHGIDGEFPESAGSCCPIPEPLNAWIGGRGRFP